MAMNYELDRHIQEALRRKDIKAAEAFKAQGQLFNALKDSNVVFELPREGVDEDLEIKAQEMDLMQLGKILDKSRSVLGMTKAELARRTEISEGYVALIAKGKRKPSRKVLEKLSANLRFTPSSQEQLIKLAGYKLSETNLPQQDS